MALLGALVAPDRLAVLAALVALDPLVVLAPVAVLEPLAARNLSLCSLRESPEKPIGPGAEPRRWFAWV
jgi:hypothetical protein